MIDPSDLPALQKALNDHKVSLFFSESPTNPYLRCVDVVKISEVCAVRLFASGAHAKLRPHLHGVRARTSQPFFS